jgi:hypothetical protein
MTDYIATVCLPMVVVLIAQEIQDLYAAPWMQGMEQTRASSVVPTRETKAMLLRPWTLRFAKDAKNGRASA